MSSRVQKGGTLFRPVAKTRGRQSAEPSSQNPTDNFNNTFSSTLASPRNTPSSSMPPPSFVPQHSTPTAVNSVVSEPSSSRVITPMRQLSTPSKSNGAKAIATPSRRSATPLIVGHLRRPPTVSRSTPHPPSSLVTASTITQNAASSGVFDPFSSFPSSTAHYSTLPTEPTNPFLPPDSTGSSSQIVHLEDVSHQQKRGASEISSELEDNLESPAKKTHRMRAKKSTDDDVENSTQKPKKSRKRRNVVESEGEGSGNNTDIFTSPMKTRRRSSTANTSTRIRKSKGPTLPPYDPDAPGVDLDPTAVTMANLCKDTGQGRVSSKAMEVMDNHIAWKASNREKRARMIAIMEAKKFGRNLEQEEEDASNIKDAPVQLEMPRAPSVDPGLPSGSSSLIENSEPAAPLAPGEFDYSQTMSSSRFNVQVRIGPNGETIVDEESLFVDTNAEQDTENYTHVEESDISKFVNSATHSKKYRGSRWSSEETELFYDALAQFGENYELISYVLPGRDRKACKNKFKAEDKRSPVRINHSLKNRVPYDIQTLSRMTGKDFSGPTPIIRAPTPVRMVESTDQDVAPPNTDGSHVVRKKSRTPAVAPGAEEEVMGDVDTFDDKDDEH